MRKKQVRGKQANLAAEDVSQDRVWRELSKQDQVNNVSRLKQVQTEYKQRLIQSCLDKEDRYQKLR